MFTDAKVASEFMLAGNAVFTLSSKRTGQHYTYRLERSADGFVWFASVRVGDEFVYVGIVRATLHHRLDLTRGSRYSEDAPVVKALRYALHHVVFKRTIPGELEIRHVGKCGKCARPLTRPDSIDRGLGPICAGFGSA
jgi:hypothetical protein